MKNEIGSINKEIEGLKQMKSYIDKKAGDIDGALLT